MTGPLTLGEFLEEQKNRRDESNDDALTRIAAKVEYALDFVEAQEYAGTEIYNDQRIAICLDCGAEKGNPHTPGGCWWLEVMVEAGRRPRP